MGTKTGFLLKEDGLDAHQCAPIHLYYSVAPSRAGTFITRHSGPIRALASLTPTVTQAQIDALLGSTNEFLASAFFDAVSVPTGDAISIIVDFDGQVEDIYAIEVITRVGTSTSSYVANVKQTSAPAAGLPVLGTPLVYVSSLGNVGIKLVPAAAFGTATTGLMIIRLHCRLK